MKRDVLETLRRKLRRFRYPALVLALGLGLLLLPTGQGQETEESQTVEEASADGFQLSEFTQSLEVLLGQIAGAGEVHLLLSLANDGARTYLLDTTQSQTDTTSQTSAETVLARVDGDEEPVTVQTSFPEFRGAVVVCQGADSATVVLEVKEALSSLTGLGMDKITVLKLE